MSLTITNISEPSLLNKLNCELNLSKTFKKAYLKQEYAWCCKVNNIINLPITAYANNITKNISPIQTSIEACYIIAHADGSCEPVTQDYLIANCLLPDGSGITAELLAKLDRDNYIDWFEMKIKPPREFDWAYYIPSNIKLVVYNGKYTVDLNYNDSNCDEGDFLICSDINNKPDKDNISVCRGSRFGFRYKLSYWQNCVLDKPRVPYPIWQPRLAKSSDFDNGSLLFNIYNTLNLKRRQKDNRQKYTSELFRKQFGNNKALIQSLVATTPYAKAFLSCKEFKAAIYINTIATPELTLYGLSKTPVEISIYPHQGITIRVKHFGTAIIERTHIGNTEPKAVLDSILSELKLLLSEADMLEELSKPYFDCFTSDKDLIDKYSPQARYRYVCHTRRNGETRYAPTLSIYLSNIIQDATTGSKAYIRIDYHIFDFVKWANLDKLYTEAGTVQSKWYTDSKLKCSVYLASLKLGNLLLQGTQEHPNQIGYWEEVIYCINRVYKALITPEIVKRLFKRGLRSVKIAYLHFPKKEETGLLDFIYYQAFCKNCYITDEVINSTFKEYATSDYLRDINSFDIIMTPNITPVLKAHNAIVTLKPIRYANWHERGYKELTPIINQYPGIIQSSLYSQVDLTGNPMLTSRDGFCIEIKLPEFNTDAEECVLTIEPKGYIYDESYSYTVKLGKRVLIDSEPSWVQSYALDAKWLEDIFEAIREKI